MILPDHELSKIYNIPLGHPHLGPASIDLEVGIQMDVWPDYVIRDPRVNQERLWRPVREMDAGGWILRPGQLYRTSTRFLIDIPLDCAGILEGRSSWARLGLTVHQTAGFLDPGYAGRPTLELSVVGAPLRVPFGSYLCQLILVRLESPASRPYSGKYQNDDVPVGSRLYLEYEQKGGPDAT